MAAGADRVLDGAALRQRRGGDRRLQLSCSRRRRGRTTRRSRWSARGGGAADGAARRGRRERRHAVRARAQRARRTTRSGWPTASSLAGQSGLCLAQPRAGRAGHGLRMVQARDRRRAAVRDAAEIAAGAKQQLLAFFANLERELERVEFFRPPEKRDTMLINLRNIFQRMQPTQQDIQTLHGVIMAIAEGRKGPARGGVLDSEEAAMLRALLAEHGRAGCRPSAARCAGSRGCCAAIRPTRSARCGTRWSMIAASPARLQAADAGRAAYRGLRVVPAAAVVDLVPGERKRGGGQDARGRARPGSPSASYR